VSGELRRLFGRLGRDPGGGTRPGGSAEWQALPHPVPGHSSIDGIPVPVVAVRRNGETGQLEVVRGYHPTPEWPGVVAPRNSRRHIVPASSFIPHPRREVIIGNQGFFYSTVSNAVSCAGCGRDDIGFGFVSSEVPLVGNVRNTADHSTLCEECAGKRATAVA
jgi:hypothetical protein